MSKKVFVIHGWTYSLDKWLDIQEKLGKKDIELIFLKVPGLTEPSDKVWDIGGYENWLEQKLKGQDQPIVIGHSNGGRIALSYIQKNPGKIARLILIDSAGIPHDNQAKAKAKLKILRIISKAGKPLGNIKPLKKLFYKLIGARDYLDAPNNMKLTMRNMLEADKSINLSEIKLPVTIIWGRDDTITPLADGKKLQAGINGSELVVIDEARHAPHFTHPQKVADIIANELGAKQ